MSPMFIIILFSEKVLENNLGDVIRMAVEQGWGGNLMVVFTINHG